MHSGIWNKIWSKHRQNTVEIPLKYRPNTFQIPSKFSPNPVKCRPNTVKMRFKCSPDAVLIQSKCRLKTVQIQSKYQLNIFTIISGHLMAFYKQWQMVHSVSLNQFYMAMSSLLHTCACLLIRPSLLNMVVSQKKPEKQPSMEEMQRVRRLSSTEQDHDSSSFQCPDTVHVQNRLLDTIR